MPAAAAGATADVEMTDANPTEVKEDAKSELAYPIAELANLRHKYEQTKDKTVGCWIYLTV